MREISTPVFQQKLETAISINLTVCRLVCTTMLRDRYGEEVRRERFRGVQLMARGVRRHTSKERK